MVAVHRGLSPHLSCDSATVELTEDPSSREKACSTNFIVSCSPHGKRAVKMGMEDRLDGNAVSGNAHVFKGEQTFHVQSLSNKSSIELKEDTQAVLGGLDHSCSRNPKIEKKAVDVVVAMEEQKDPRLEGPVLVEFVKDLKASKSDALSSQMRKACSTNERDSVKQSDFSDIPDGTPLWAKWRGNWQPAIKTAPNHCREAILKAKPTYASKSYLLVFFPRTATFVWADSQALLPISEDPNPLAYGSHNLGRAITSDPHIPRKISLLRVGGDVLDISDRLHVKAVTEAARSASMWKGFAQRAAKAESYNELGQLLVDTFEVIISAYVNAFWLEHRCSEWKAECLLADKASNIEHLNEELIDSVSWEKVQPFWDEPDQPDLASDWQTWKEPWTRAHAKLKSLMTAASKEGRTGVDEGQGLHRSDFTYEDEWRDLGWKRPPGGKSRASTSKIRGKHRTRPRPNGPGLQLVSQAARMSGGLTMPPLKLHLEASESFGPDLESHPEFRDIGSIPGASKIAGRNTDEHSQATRDFLSAVSLPSLLSAQPSGGKPICRSRKASTGIQCTHTAKPGSFYCQKHVWKGVGEEGSRSPEREGSTVPSSVTPAGDGVKLEPKEMTADGNEGQRCTGMRAQRLGGGQCPHPRRPGLPFCGRHARYAYRGEEPPEDEEGVDNESNGDEGDLTEQNHETKEELEDLADEEQCTAMVTSWRRQGRCSRRKKPGELVCGLHARWQTLNCVKVQSDGLAGDTIPEIYDEERCISDLTSWGREGRCPHKRKPGQAYCGFHKRWRFAEDTMAGPAKRQKAGSHERADKEEDVETEMEEDDQIVKAVGGEMEEGDGNAEVCIAVRSTRGGGRCTQSRKPGFLYCGKHLKKATQGKVNGMLSRGQFVSKATSWLWKDLTNSIANDLKKKAGEAEGEVKLIEVAQEALFELTEQVEQGSRSYKACRGFNKVVDESQELIHLSNLLDMAEKQVADSSLLGKKLLQLVDVELDKLLPVVDYLELRSKVRSQGRGGLIQWAVAENTALAEGDNVRKEGKARLSADIRSLQELRIAAMETMEVANNTKLGEDASGAQLRKQGEKKKQFAGKKRLREWARMGSSQGLDEDCMLEASQVEEKRSKPKCKYCNKRFEKQMFLYRHLIMGKCRVPGEGTKPVGSLDGEQKSTAAAGGSDKAYACRVCGEIFSLLPDLGRHWKGEHREAMLARRDEKLKRQRMRKRVKSEHAQRTSAGEHGGGKVEMPKRASVDADAEKGLYVGVGTEAGKEGALKVEHAGGSDPVDISKAHLRERMAQEIPSGSEAGQDRDYEAAVQLENREGVWANPGRGMSSKVQVLEYARGKVDETSDAREDPSLQGREIGAGVGDGLSGQKLLMSTPGDEEILMAAREGCCLWRLLQKLQHQYKELPESVGARAAELCSSAGFALNLQRCIGGCRGWKTSSSPTSSQHQRGTKFRHLTGSSSRPGYLSNAGTASLPGKSSPSKGGRRKHGEPEAGDTKSWGLRKVGEAAEMAGPSEFSQMSLGADPPSKRPKLDVIRGRPERLQSVNGEWTQAEDGWNLPDTALEGDKRRDGEGETVDCQRHGHSSQWGPKPVSQLNGYVGAQQGAEGNQIFHSMPSEQRYWGAAALVADGCPRGHVVKRVLCDDLSGGAEPVPIACVIDDDVLESLGCDALQENRDKLRPADGFTYITRRRLDPALGLDPRNSQLGCHCSGNQCTAATCEHVALFAEDNGDACDIYGEPMLGRFPYDSKGHIILQEDFLVYECNSQCHCGDGCSNRVLQRGVRVRLEVFRTQQKGWAVRAAQPIPRGTFVCEYIGEVVDDKEAQKRGLRYDQVGLSYLYDIDAHIDASALRRGVRPFVIDATTVGNVARFINHSCAPNLVNYQVLVESMDYQLAHIGLYAARDIWPGEELAYDYRYKLLPGKGCPCYCGAPTCRGRLY